MNSPELDKFLTDKKVDRSQPSILGVRDFGESSRKLEDIGFYSLSNNRAENTSETSGMKRCEMIITEYCNFKCPYCRGLAKEIYGNRLIKQLSYDEMVANIDDWCKDEPLENIRFSGGEPTLHKSLARIVEYSKAKGIKRIAISTNGYNNLYIYKKLIEAGVNDISISLDACCSADGDYMSGGVPGSWKIVTDNIMELSKLTYVTVGVVLTPENVAKAVDTIIYAHTLGVADIRVVTAVQYNKPILVLSAIPQYVLDAHPILKYRVGNYVSNRNIRGLRSCDSGKCALVMDDSIVAGRFHYPCPVYMREQGKPIGITGPNMRQERIEWFKNHNCHKDEICKNSCLDICVDYNNKYYDSHE